MVSEYEELYLIKLKRYIYDEGKIVTAIWLSRKLSLDIHLCHKLLKQFVEDEKTTVNPLGVTYTLTGETNEGRHSIMLVNYDKLNDKKKMFKDIKSEQVYSIQKAKDINFNSIGLVDLFNIHGDTEPILGSAIGKNCMKRASQVNKKVLPTVSRAPGTDKSKASHLFINGNSKKLVDKAESSTTTDKSNNEEVMKEKKEVGKKLAKQHSGDKDKNKNSLANMFANVPPPKEKPVKINTEVKEEAMEVDDSDASDVEEAPRANSKSEIKTKSKTGRYDLYDSGTDEEAKKVEEENKRRKVVTNGKEKDKEASSAKKSKRQRDKSVEKSQKKRKRIVVHVESDEDIFADDNDDQEENESKGIIESDEEVKPAKHLAPKNKKRKYVDKTYTDEEGYIVTKKELVYESNDETDENEEPPLPKPKEAKKASPKEVNEPSPPKKNGRKKPTERPTNQPTLMTFFKKK